MAEPTQTQPPQTTQMQTNPAPPPPPDQPVQIQITRVDNGFIVQGVSIDGQRKGLRRVAMSEEDLRKHLHEIADMVYAREDVKSGPAGSQSPS